MKTLEESVEKEKLKQVKREEREEYRRFKRELRYGDPVLSRLAQLDPTVKDYYDSYIESGREYWRDEVIGYICGLCSLGLLILEMLSQEVVIGVALCIWLVLMVQSFMNVRVERLWRMRWMDKIVDLADYKAKAQVLEERRSREDKKAV